MGRHKKPVITDEEASAAVARMFLNDRKPRRQKGEILETSTAFFGRFYTTVDGARKQKAVMLAHKSDLYRTKRDVRQLMDRLMQYVNCEAFLLSGRVTLTEYIENHYLPWIRTNKAAATADGYRKLWNKLKPSIGSIALVDLTTVQISALLTALAASLGVRSLSHVKWFLSGAYEHAIATGVVPANPVPAAKWLCRVDRVEKQVEYSLEQVLAMLRILEPLDLRAAVAVALAYFAALRPAEIRGLQWTDYNGAELTIRRAVWRAVIGDTKTEGSQATVPVIEPLRSLLERLRTQSPDGYMLQGHAGKPLNLDSLNVRTIAPAMRMAGITWAGFYPCRRGISSLITGTSKNVLNATGMLRHANPSTTLKHYTQSSKDDIAAALKTIEALAAQPEETIQ